MPSSPSREAGRMTQTTRTNRASRTRELGAHGERLAAEYLQGLGCRVLDRNWRSGRQGELDLVVRDGGSIVAVEVKTRSGSGYGTPFESITALKVARLRRLLLGWVREHQPGARGLRVDAVSVTLRPNEAPRIEHLRGIS